MKFCRVECKKSGTMYGRHGSQSLLLQLAIITRRSIAMVNQEDILDILNKCKIIE